MTDQDFVHRISVVTPVYKGELTLPALAEEIAALTTEHVSPGGHRWKVTEWLLAWDNGPDGSADVIGELAERYDFVKPVWLSRNFGQHPATLAGMASSTGDWIATIDEDGQHDPADLPAFLDTAMAEQAQLVYADPTNPAPHGAVRNVLSAGAKWVFATFLTGTKTTTFQSYRLMIGDAGRSVAAYAGHGVYLDVALGWVMGRITHVPVALRQEGGRASGYNMKRLISHFWRLVLSSGTRGLRIVSGIGAAFAVLGVLYALSLVISSLAGAQVPQGWTSTIVILLVSTGLVLFCLGVIAEYVGVAVNMAMGKPPYLILNDPAAGPFGRRPGAPVRHERAAQPLPGQARPSSGPQADDTDAAATDARGEQPAPGGSHAAGHDSGQFRPQQ
ncbi:glycosyltransferase [Nigerium massiliense]|uniref:glycosyltransferase n=1 Tax=Nigerium massiliense TaxID=1522317 RepID=UPI000907B8B5|nr:glycosyltransferase [Nigerium massiliense]